MSDKKTLVPVDCSPGSRPLKVSKYERYARYRAAALPRIEAFRKIGNEAALDKTATITLHAWKNAQASKNVSLTSLNKRKSASLKSVLASKNAFGRSTKPISKIFSRYTSSLKPHKDGEIETDQNGQMRDERKERPRLISDLAPDIAKLIEDVTADHKGRLIPRFYSKLQASKELRAMLNIGRPERESDLSRLSDAELIQQLADQAKELGVEIDLNYSFLKRDE